MTPEEAGAATAVVAWIVVGGVIFFSPLIIANLRGLQKGPKYGVLGFMFLPLLLFIRYVIIVCITHPYPWHLPDPGTLSSIVVIGGWIIALLLSIFTSKETK